MLVFLSFKVERWKERKRESERAKQSAALLHSGLVCCPELWIAAAAIPEYHSSPESELGADTADGAGLS